MKNANININKLNGIIENFENQDNNVKYIVYSALAALSGSLWYQRCLHAPANSSIAMNPKNWDTIIDKKDTENRFNRNRNHLVWCLIRLGVMNVFVKRKNGVFNLEKAEDIRCEFLNYVEEKGISLRVNYVELSKKLK